MSRMRTSTASIPMVHSSQYVERKNRCEDLQYKNTCMTLNVQHQRFLKSASQERAALYMEIRQMEKLNKSRGNKKMTSSSSENKGLQGKGSVRFKQGLPVYTGGGFRNLQFQTVHSIPANQPNQRTFHRQNTPINITDHCMDCDMRTEVLDFDDIRPKSSLSNRGEEDRLTNMERRYSAQTQSNSVIKRIQDEISKVRPKQKNSRNRFKLRETKSASFARESRRNFRDTDNAELGCRGHGCSKMMASVFVDSRLKVHDDSSDCNKVHVNVQNGNESALYLPLDMNRSQSSRGTLHRFRPSSVPAGKIPSFCV